LRAKDRATTFSRVGTTGLRVQVTNRESRASFEKLVASLPVRIGRDPLNDVVLEYPFVSKFHVVVDSEQVGLVARDLGSRNGTWLQDGTVRIPPNSVAPLAGHTNQFSIGILEIAVERAEIPAGDVRGDGGGRSLFTGRHAQTAPGFASPATPLPAELSALGGELRPHFDAYRREWGNFLRKLNQGVAPLSLERRAEVLVSLSQQFGEATQEPEFQRLSGTGGVTGVPHREAVKALAVVRELADWYLGEPLQTEADIDGFAGKLRKALDVFLLSFVPLRNGLRRSQNELAGLDRTADRSRIENAATPSDVATSLLDWRNPADEARSVHGIFADIMVHQISLVSGVMKGVEALLDKLAPTQINADVRTKGGFVFGPWRFRALWNEFRRRHDDYGEEPFSVIFGPEFEKTYRQLFDEAVPRSEHGNGSRALSISKTPETHGFPSPPVGPYGTVVVPRAPKKESP
jgi:type VI secretion system protein ImpI